MAVRRSTAIFQHHLQPIERQIFGKTLIRCTSTTAGPADAHTGVPSTSTPHTLLQNTRSPLQRMSTSTLIRRMIMCTFFTSPILFTPGLAAMNFVANSKLRIFNPDDNKLLRKLVKPLVYDQFCAGTNKPEIHTTTSDFKTLGFSGVALCYAKESQHEDVSDEEMTIDNDIAQWKNGTLTTLDMIGAGDWIGIKVTGAGPRVMKALAQGQAPTAEFLDAIDAICAKAKNQGCRIWVDAEQQAVQKSIDTWTIDLMRRWNRDGAPLIYNTTQAYLKESRSKLQRHLQLAQEEGWTLGVKLVRGAYIARDRGLIWDTKEETDKSYNGIVKELLEGTFPGLAGPANTKFELLLCGHNPTTIKQASTMAQELSQKGQLRVYPEFAQLQGMGDDVGLSLINSADAIRRNNTNTLITANTFIPRVYKCLHWGSIQECMQYLIRRAIENRGALDRIKDDASLFAGELRRRFRNTIRL